MRPTSGVHETISSSRWPWRRSPRSRAYASASARLSRTVPPRCVAATSRAALGGPLRSNCHSWSVKSVLAVIAARPSVPAPGSSRRRRTQPVHVLGVLHQRNAVRPGGHVDDRVVLAGGGDRLLRLDGFVLKVLIGQRLADLDLRAPDADGLLVALLGIGLRRLDLRA